MKKILVTGGAGFVGRHLIKALLLRGDEVHCVDSLAPLTGGIAPSNGWPLFNPLDFKNFHFYQIDCRDWFRQNLDNDFDYAFHLAAMVGGRLMIENNPMAVADDLSIDAAFWQWATATTPGRSVCFSSSAAYPIHLQKRDGYIPLEESMISFNDHIGMPDMTYGWAKLTSEYLARLAHEKYGLKTVSFRPFSGYGSDQDLAYPFPSICKRILSNQKSNVISVWGSGTQMRDFIHIDDCSRGILILTDKIDDGGAINLSTGIYTSFLDLAKLISNEIGINPEIQGQSSLPEGVFARAGDTKKQSILGFTPEIALTEGIQDALSYLNRAK